MTPPAPSTLYSDRESQWFFLIPDHITVMPGDFEIVTLLGHSQKVNPEAVAQHQVSRDEAQAWLQGQMRGFLDKAQAGIQDLLYQIAWP